ncbi:MAG TPA: SIS domain-containing protein [Capillimicrobium sp.]
MSESTRWLRAALPLLQRLEREAAGDLEAASRLCADAIGSGGLVHLFGTGHSRIPLEEMFPRYGSYPGFQPLAELSMTFHTQVVGANGQRQAMFIERVSGLADAILANFDLAAPDALLVFSASGRSAVPIEMAQGARSRGLPVIAVTSLAESRAQPATHPAGRLCDLADVTIDLGTPPGDALVAVDGWEAPVGPGSTMANVAVVNCLKVRTAELLAERGVELPVLSAASVVGRERSEQLFDAAYREHARRASAALSR